MANNRAKLTTRELLFLIVYAGASGLAFMYLLLICAAPFKAFFLIGMACAMPVFLERKK